MWVSEASEHRASGISFNVLLWHCPRRPFSLSFRFTLYVFLNGSLLSNSFFFRYTKPICRTDIWSYRFYISDPYIGFFWFSAWAYFHLLCMLFLGTPLLDWLSPLNRSTKLVHYNSKKDKRKEQLRNMFLRPRMRSATRDQALLEGEIVCIFAGRSSLAQFSLFIQPESLGLAYSTHPKSMR